MTLRERTFLGMMLASIPWRPIPSKAIRMTSRIASVMYPLLISSASRRHPAKHDRNAPRTMFESPTYRMIRFSPFFREMQLHRALAAMVRVFGPDKFLRRRERIVRFVPDGLPFRQKVAVPRQVVQQCGGIPPGKRSRTSRSVSYRIGKPPGSK